MSEKEIKSAQAYEEHFPLMPLEDFEEDGVSIPNPETLANIAQEIDELAPEIEVHYHITEALKALRRLRTDERSPRNRLISVCITEAEKLYAFFVTYVLTRKDMSFVGVAKTLIFGANDEEDCNL